MVRSILSIVACWMLIALQGCATNRLEVTYQSDPPGATLYHDGQMMGYTPVTLYYPVTDEDRTRGFAVYKGASVRWVSGATAQVETVRANLAIGSRQQF